MPITLLFSLVTLNGPAGIIAGSAFLALALSASFISVYATIWGARQPPAVRAYLLTLVRALWWRK